MKKHGKGTFTWSNGNRFVGQWRNDKDMEGTYLCRWKQQKTIFLT